MRWIMSLGLCLCLLLSACSQTPNEPLYKPSPQAFDFSWSGSQAFVQYQNYTSNYLANNRVFYAQTAAQKAVELERVAPFQLTPDKSCRGDEKRGVLLVHGVLGQLLICVMSVRSCGKIVC